MTTHPHLEGLILLEAKMRMQAAAFLAVNGFTNSKLAEKITEFADELAALAALPGGGVDEKAGYYLASFKRGRDDGTVMWWMPNDCGYSHDLEQAGIYTELTPGYHDSDDTVPVPVAFIERLRVRRVVDFGDTLNTAFHNAKSLRAILAMSSTPPPHEADQ